jgi:hypothetical protein
MAVRKPVTTDDVRVGQADVDQAEVHVKNPMTGSVTTVPKSLVDVLVESGYTVEK